MLLVGLLTSLSASSIDRAYPDRAAAAAKSDSPIGPSDLLASTEQAVDLIRRGAFQPEVVEYENNISGNFTYEFTLEPEHGDRKVRLTGVLGGSQERRDLLRAITESGMTLRSEAATIDQGKQEGLGTILPSLLFYAAILGGAYYVFRRMFGSDSAMTTAEGEVFAGGKMKDRFADIGGMEHVLDEMRELKSKVQLVQQGDTRINLPRGTLFTGPPGVGKTMLARALAGEVEAPFVKFDCSQLSTQLYVGTGTARVTNAFALARKLRDEQTKELRKRPGATGKEEGVAILCLDEFESIGMRRADGRDSNRGDTEHLKVVNTLLNEMDGFNQGRNRNIIVFAATNNPEVLDPALLRPGRFTRKIHIDLPRSTSQRLEILEALEWHVLEKRGFKVEDGKALEYIARITPGKSGDHLRQILQEASELAQIAGRNEVSQADLFEAAQRSDMGRIKKNYLSRDRHELVAHHEHGHALAAIACGVGVFLVSMMPRGDSAGRVIPNPEGLSESLTTMRDYLARIYLGAGGRAAELARYGKEGVTDGAISDIEQIQGLVATMITVGMLDDMYSMNLRRTPPVEWKAEHHAIINRIAARAVEMNKQMIEVVGAERMENLVRDSLALQEELVADKAREFYEKRLDPGTIASMRTIAETFIKDPLGNGCVQPGQARAAQP